VVRMVKAKIGNVNIEGTPEEVEEIESEQGA
jgi:hypothetical protein